MNKKVLLTIIFTFCLLILSFKLIEIGASFPPLIASSLSISNLRSLIEINQTMSKTSCFTLKNNGTGNVSNIIVSLSGIPNSWFVINPASIQNLNSLSNISICLGFSIPEDAIVIEYPITINVSDGESTSSRTILRVDEYINETPIPTQCPDSCSEPTNWTECSNYFRMRINYHCNETTNYTCQIFIERENCGIILPPGFDFYGLLFPLSIVIAALIPIFAIYRFREKLVPHKIKENVEVRKIVEMKQKFIEKKSTSVEKKTEPIEEVKPMVEKEKPVPIEEIKPLPVEKKQTVPESETTEKVVAPIEEMICPKCNSKMELKYKGDALSFYKCKSCGYKKIKKTETSGS